MSDRATSDPTPPRLEPECQAPAARVYNDPATLERWRKVTANLGDKEFLYEIANRAGNYSDADAAYWMESIYYIASIAIERADTRANPPTEPVAPDLAQRVHGLMLRPGFQAREDQELLLDCYNALTRSKPVAWMIKHRELGYGHGETWPTKADALREKGELFFGAEYEIIPLYVTPTPEGDFVLVPREDIQRVLDHDPSTPGLDFGGDYKLLLESALSVVRDMIAAASTPLIGGESDQ